MHKFDLTEDHLRHFVADELRATVPMQYAHAYAAAMPPDLAAQIHALMPIPEPAPAPEQIDEPAPAPDPIAEPIAEPEPAPIEEAPQ